MSEREYEQEYVYSEPVRKRKRKSLFVLILRDILMAGIILCVFALFHHVIPILSAKNDPPPETRPIEVPAAATPAPVTVAEESGDELSVDEPEDTEPEPDPNEGKTEWQIKFADKFTDEVVTTINSYTSPNVSISISMLEVDEPVTSTCFVADIYVASMDCFRTYFANGVFSYYGSESPKSYAVNSGAIVSINGDYCDNQKSGFLVRNGELYYDEPTSNDICVLFHDGTMQTFAAGTYDPEQIVAAGAYQSWKFGPELLDAEGHAKSDFNCSKAIAWENPRSAIGYYEPGHYCFVIVDGRQNGYSRGLEIDKLAALFEDLGCTAAYNLDGGASAVMTFNGEIFSRPSNGGRDSGDILLICEPAESASAEEPEG